MSRTNDDAQAYRTHARQKATQEFREVIRRNTPEYGRSMTDDQRAYSDDAIRR